jgi:hypothetical protein
MAVGLEISSRLARAATWYTINSDEVRKAINIPPKIKMLILIMGPPPG